MSNESEQDAADETEQQHVEADAENVGSDGGSEPVDAEESAEPADAAEDAESEGGLQHGDFVEVDYTAHTVEDDRFVDTTDPELAEEEGVEDTEDIDSRVIVLGEGHIFDAVEEGIVGSEVGDSGSVVVPASEAFGEFDEDDVRTVSKDKIPEDDRYPGAQVQIEGEEGFLETIIGGRARVDFNHPLAGSDIEYEYEILREVDDRHEKAQGLLEIMLGMELEMRFETDTEEEQQLVESDGDEDDESEPEYETVEVEKETLYVEATPQLSMNQQWMMGKQQIGQQLIDLLGIDRMIVQETIDGTGGMMGGMGGMMGGMGGGDIEEALEDEDIDAEELAEELE